MDAEEDPNITQFAHAQKVALGTIVTTIFKFSSSISAFRFSFPFTFSVYVFRFIRFHLPCPHLESVQDDFPNLTSLKQDHYQIFTIDLKWMILLLSNSIQESKNYL